eukprot:86384_1
MNLNAITLADVRAQHQKFQNTRNEQSLDTEKLVKILGGYSAILNNYLSSDKSSPLTNKQLRAIHQLLSIPNNINHVRKTGNKHVNSEVLTLSSNNTFFHGTFQTHIADRIIAFIFSKILVFIVSVMTFSFTILQMVISTSSSSWHWCFLIWNCIMFIYCIGWLLSLNKRATVLIMNTFEFWFKIFYCFRLLLCWFIWMQNWKSKFSSVTVVLDVIVFVMTVTAFCFLDAIKLQTTFKATLLIFISILWTVVTYKYTFAPKHLITLKVYLWREFCLELEIMSLCASSMRIISIFAWKQTYYSIFKKTQSSLIKRAVRIVWM